MTLIIALSAVATFITAGQFFFAERPFPLLVARHGLGALLVAAVQLATIAFLTLAIPIRACGLLEGPRWRGYFEQLVASGMAPWRYFAGRALVSQALIALAIAATAPVLALFWILDPAPWGWVLEGYVLIIVYAETLLAVSLGLGVLMNEFAAVPCTILITLAIHVIALMPVPSAIMALSPVRFVIAPFAPTIAAPDAAVADALYGAPRPFGLEVPYLPYAASLSLLVAALAAASCVFGPLHGMVPGLNNFGAVVLPGDRRRPAFLRKRPALQRRAEVAFFFENRGPLLTRLAPWVRLLQIAILLALPALLIIAGLVNPSMLSILGAGRMDEDDIVAFVPVTLAITLILGPCIFSTSRTESRLELGRGHFRVATVYADLAVYALVLCGLATFLMANIDRILPAVTPRRLPDLAAIRAVATEWCAILCFVSFTALVIAKSIGLRTHQRGAGFLAVLLLVLTPLLLLFVNPSTLRYRDEEFVRTPEQNARIMAALHVAWPLRMALALNPREIDGVALPETGALRWLALRGFWVTYPALAIFQLGIIAMLLRRRRKEADEELAAIALGAKT
jgi:hypothetical protein